MRARACLLGFVLILAACGGAPVYRDTNVPIASKADLDLDRYTGLWYEIARFPVRFQEGCTAVTAEYAQIGDDRISVVNTCRDGAPDGPERRVEGTARVTGPGRLGVRFSGVPFIRAPYWVLWVDADYRTAVVGVPSGRAGWILNREPEIASDRLKAALEVLDFNGYDLREIVPTPQPPSGKP
ncbi:MAG: lipocalin family protein [Pseudomonadota bacterium]